MILSSGGERNRLAAAVSVLLLTGLAACSSDSSDGVEPLPAQSSTASTASSTAADEKAVTDTYQRYWQAAVTAENSATFDPAAFTGIAEGSLVDELSAKIDYYQEIDLKRVGEPVFQDYEAVVTGDSATVTVCVNQDDWKPEGVEQEAVGFSPVGAELARRDDSWVVTSLLDVETITRTCS